MPNKQLEVRIGAEVHDLGLLARAPQNPRNSRQREIDCNMVRWAHERLSLTQADEFETMYFELRRNKRQHYNAYEAQQVALERVKTMKAPKPKKGALDEARHG